MTGKRIWDDEKIIRLINERRTTREITETIGCSAGKVRHLAREQGLITHSNKCAPVDCRPGEVWKPLICGKWNCPDIEVSNYGRARSWLVIGRRYGSSRTRHTEPHLLKPVRYHKNGEDRTEYVRITARDISGKSWQIDMHRPVAWLFIGVPSDPELEVDHKDHNGLNNDWRNLRWCTRPQNNFNRRSFGKVSSQYRGVFTSNGSKAWVVSVGGFKDEVIAARAADLLIRLAHGEFAMLNFPDDAPLAA